MTALVVEKRDALRSEMRATLESAKAYRRLAKKRFIERRSGWERMSANRAHIVRSHNEGMASLDLAIKAMEAAIEGLWHA